ncbi:hypothetical protein [Gallaecimonas pentaromativorans]|uniref:hypothetical protein n=1 Tax=Gallaecimonas pentaromativorans TaxID=584787 RepID=UPI003A908C56
MIYYSEQLFRKSSLVRCLTGVGGGNAQKRLDIKLMSGREINVYCILSALQENYKPKTPQEFIDYINALKPIPSDVIFTLRANSAGSYPNASSYISAFTAVHWNISSIALLGSVACSISGLPSTANIESVLSSSTQPTNETASFVRKKWGWC